MTSAAIQNELVKVAPFAQIFFSDEEYAIMSEESARGTFKWLKWLLKAFGIWGWSKKFQCDDFALVWLGLHNLRHAKAKASDRRV